MFGVRRSKLQAEPHAGATGNLLVLIGFLLMLGLRRKAAQPQAPTAVTPPIRQVGDARYLVSDKTYNARRATPVLRVIGNLLILTGVLMLLGIGGWYGYNQWSNAQFLQDHATRFPRTPTPTAQAIAAQPTVEPAPTRTPITFADLASKNIGTGQWNVPRQTDNSPPVRLHIPSVGIDSEVVPVGWDMIPKPDGSMSAEWQVADYAVGHHKGSANPGQVGNVVLSGHVDYKGEVFRWLHNVNKGDQVIVYTEKGQYLYVIVDVVIVFEEGAPPEQRRQNARYMDHTPDQTLTMITCWPYGIDTHRLIAIAKPYQSTLSTQSEFSIR